MPTSPILEFSFKDLWNSIKVLDKNAQKRRSDKTQYNALRSSSIAKATQKLIFSFPVICSDAVSPETATMISKACEKNCVSMLQMLLTSMYLTGYNGADVISKFHTNLGNDMDLVDYIDKAAGLIDDEKDMYHRASSLAGMFKESAVELQREFQKSLSKTYPDSSFSENSLNDYFVTSDYNGYNVRLASVNEARYNRYNQIKDDANANRDSVSQARYAEIQKELDAAKAQRSQDKRKIEDLQKELDKLNSKDRNFQYQKDARDNFRKDRDYLHKVANDTAKNNRDDINSRHNYLTKQLLPSDAQKANELQPTLMLIRYAVPNDKSGVADVEQEFVAGVKTHLTPLPSAEIIDQFGKYLKNRITNLQLVKATTGEISFSKDLMAAVKDAKLDAKKDNLSATSPIWRMLQARSAASGARRVAHSRNTAAAITTLVITQQEVEIIQMDYNFDLLNPANAMKFMQTYNLLCFVIVDDSTDTAKFLYDAEKFYTTYSYTALEREIKNGMSERAIVNLIGHAH